VERNRENGFLLLASVKLGSDKTCSEVSYVAPLSEDIDLK
jgi:hypothetical protein